MREYTAPGWGKILSSQNLFDFDALWKLELELLDTPNTQRRGWSSAARMMLRMPEGDEKEVILKRQLNHNSRTYLHPISGIPTFEKEMKNSLKYEQHGIPALKVIHYAKRKYSDGIRAVLITEYLNRYQSLEALLDSWEKLGKPNQKQRNQIIEAIARYVQKLHEKKIQHNCLYPKHVFIRQKGDRVDIRVIDLEKSKWRPFGNRRRVRDLESLSRRMGSWKNTDLIRFILNYYGIQRLDLRAKRLCRKILSRTEKKIRRRSDKVPKVR